MNRRATTPRKPRRNDSGWRADCIAARGEWCRCCGARPVEMDHVVPRSQGGPSIVENGLPLCNRHHDDKTNSRLRFRYEWFDADQIEWLAAVGWVAWDDDGQPYGRGAGHFEPLTPTQTARRRAGTDGRNAP